MKQARRAFTLIELLVVVAIIALLISILLPSLAAARDQAKSAVCAANLKSQSQAMAMYLDENKDFFPGEHAQIGRDGYNAWAPRIRLYANYVNDIFWCPSTDVNQKWNMPFDWTMRRGYDHTALGYQPGERPLTGGSESRPEFMSYGYNAGGVESQENAYNIPHLGLGVHIITTGNENLEQINHSEKQRNKCARPDDLIVIGDSVADGIWDTIITPARTDFHSWPGRRHKDGSNIIFGDMSVRWLSFESLLDQEDWLMRRWNNDWQPHREAWE